jgi:DNA-binding LacI/PurR family transcriptional regulator
MNNNKVSIEEVAKLAGVSKTTISHALSGNRHVSQKTREKIDKVIKKLGYFPNYMAKGLALKKTGILGMIFPTPLSDSNHRESVEFIFSAANKINSLGYKFLLMTGNYGEETRHILEITRGGHIDGVVLMDIRLNDRRAELLAEEKFPFVMIGRNKNYLKFNFVDIDATGALYEGVNYLVSQGHKDILFIGISPKTFGFTEKSIKGFKKAMDENNLPYDNDSFCFCPSDDKMAFELMTDIMKRLKFTAVITGSDMIAAGVIKAVNASGMQIPQDISLISFGNSQVCEMTNPRMTALSLRYKEMSEEAVEMLVKIINNHDVAENHIILKSFLVQRDSVKKINKSC